MAEEYEELKKQILERKVSNSSQVGSHFTNKLIIHLINSIKKLDFSTAFLSKVMIWLIVAQLVFAGVQIWLMAIK